jgi:type IV secretory pathway VirD2 relaxase
MVVRGVDERGKNLVISRDYISQGIRIKAQEIATRELGLRTELDLQSEQQRSLTQGRYSGIDRQLEREAAAHEPHLIDLRSPPAEACSFARRNYQNKQLRLEYLKALGLAEQVEFGLWKLNDKMAEELRALAIRNDIIKTLHQKMRMQEIMPGSNIAIFDKHNPPAELLIGEVLQHGYADEISDSKCVVMAAADGRAYYVPLSPNSEVPGHACRVGDTVTIRVDQKEREPQIALEVTRRQRAHGLELDLEIPR